MKEEIVNKHHSDGDRDINPVVFLGDFLNKDLLPKSLDVGSNEIEIQFISWKKSFGVGREQRK